jgi:hypothetical protein
MDESNEHLILLNIDSTIRSRNRSDREMTCCTIYIVIGDLGIAQRELIHLMLECKLAPMFQGLGKTR